MRIINRNIEIIDTALPKYGRRVIPRLCRRAPKAHVFTRQKAVAKETYRNAAG